MNLRPFLLLLVAVPSGCKSSGGGDLARELMILSEEAKTGLGVEVPEAESVLGDLDNLIGMAKERAAGKSGEQIIDAVNRFLFEELSFQSEVGDDRIEFMLLPNVIKNRKGSCLGLAGLYLVLAESLGVEVSAVLVPRHFFLRSGKRNIELLRKGEAMPDWWYRENWQVPEPAPAYMRPLTRKELLAVFRYNLGNAYRLKGDYSRAARLYRDVVGSFPDFAEAHANLGLVFQLQKDYPAALQAYRIAAAIQPGLPGLKQNLQVLKTDMGEAK